MAHCASPEFSTPLFMAAEVGYESLFEAMMRQPVTSELPADAMRQYRTLIVLGAILAKNKGNYCKGLTNFSCFGELSSELGNLGN